MLEQLQTGFLSTIRGSASAIGLGPSTISHDQTWRIYQRNYMQSHVAALVDTYSTVCSLVGERYFRHVAEAYVSQSDSKDGDLNEYGADFPAYLTGVVGIRETPYLPDIARLDWHWLQQLRAPIHHQDWLPYLLSMDSHRWPAVRAVSGAVRVASRSPIFAIWEMTALGGEPVDLATGAQTVLITRLENVKVTLLSPAEDAFLVRWLSGSTLEASLEHAFEICQELEIGPLLTRMATIGAVQSIESTL